MNQINCPYCKKKISSSEENCPACGKELPWMSHIYKRENSLTRAIKTLVVDTYQSIVEKRTVNKSKILGLLNAFMVSRAVLLVGSFLGGVFILVEIIFLFNQQKLLENQEVLMKRENALITHEKYEEIRELFLRHSDSTTIYWESSKLVPQPNISAVNQVADLVKSNQEAFMTILFNLLDDNNHSVRLGAFLTLLKFETLPRPLKVELDGIYFKNYRIENKVIDELDINGSYVDIVLDSSSIGSLSINASYVQFFQLENSIIDYLSLHQVDNYFFGLFDSSRISSSYIRLNNFQDDIRIDSSVINVSNFESNYFTRKIQHQNFPDSGYSYVLGENSYLLFHMELFKWYDTLYVPYQDRDHREYIRFAKNKVDLFDSVKVMTDSSTIMSLLR